MRALLILKLRSAIGLAMFSVLISGSLIAKADVIAKRKANFKASSTALKAINAALGRGNFYEVIIQAKTIANWARVMPDYFPENSDVGDSKARADVWMNFDGFKSHASANEKAALTLISTAKTGDVSATIRALKKLGGTCKSCHKNFKN